MRAYFYYAPFYYQNQGSFLETYLTVIGNSVEFKLNENNKYQSSLEVVMLFKQDGKIQEFKKYNLLSPEITDTLSLPNFIDQQRVSLKNGTYYFELSIKDNFDTLKKHIISDVITINYTNDEFEFSGIQFIESYKQTTEQNKLSKNGYDLVPYVSDFFPTNINQFIFYCELYNTNKLIGDSLNYVLIYYLENAKSKITLNDYSRLKKQKANNQHVLFGEFNIEKLPSGVYNLVIEIRDKENSILKIKKIAFTRSKPSLDKLIPEFNENEIANSFVAKYTDIDTLKEYINCTFPICDNMENVYAKTHIESNNIKNMQSYFYGFWVKRNFNNPEKAWNDYKEQVKMVNRLYSSQIRKGYETDRGRVYLQYGAPNTVTDSKHEPSAYPYEIWHYYVIKDETNKKFIFYNPQLAGNDYDLLHSDVTGEIFTKNWERVLHKRNTTLSNPDEKNTDEHYGGKAKEMFDNPR
ncbi:MAG: hypothetical protein A2046_12210 [Bacteroidetes bacterium GWA2_30_7]|nr:MAG: hypothetical protein A2046_12210 [Bacteroidetes bacterium GWA2_30_7]